MTQCCPHTVPTVTPCRTHVDLKLWTHYDHAVPTLLPNGPQAVPTLTPTLSPLSPPSPHAIPIRLPPTQVVPGRGAPGWGAVLKGPNHVTSCPPAAGEVDLLLGGGAEAHDRARLQEHDRAGGLGPAVLGGCQRCPRPCTGSRCISLLPGLLSRPLTSPPSDLTATLGLRPRPLASRPL